MDRRRTFHIALMPYREGKCSFFQPKAEEDDEERTLPNPSELLTPKKQSIHDDH